MSLRRSLAFAAATLSSSVLASVSPTGYTVSLTDISYFIPPKAVGKLSITESLSAKFDNGPFVPITVIPATASNFTAADVSALVSQYLAEDDVFQKGFLDGMFTKRHSMNMSTILI